MSVPSCDVCAKSRHVECFQVLSDHPDDRCGCYDADSDRHETDDAHHFAMFGEYPYQEDW